MISIEGLDKAEVLKVLYDNSKIQGLGFLQAKKTPLTIEEAKELLARSTYFDYLYGKILKIDLSEDHFEEYLYDRDLGNGAAQAAINSLKGGTR